MPAPTPTSDQIKSYIQKRSDAYRVINDVTGKLVWEDMFNAWETNECREYTRKLNKNCLKDLQGDKQSYMYITLSPDKLLRNLDATPANVNVLHEWCEKWFAHNKKYYRDYCYVVESGKHGDHLHVHAICELITSHKHAENLKKFWAKYFPNNQLVTSVDLSSKAYKAGKKRGEYAYLRIDDPTILTDKLEYFENEKKGTHENLTDLGVRGSRGFLTDNI